MAELRNRRQRKADVLLALEGNADVWLATAGGEKPHLIAASAWWDGSRLVIATRGGSATARNLRASKVARVALGSPENVVMIDVALSEDVPVGAASQELKRGFVQAAGWDPAEEGDDWVFFGLTPVQVQAYRGYGELQGRYVMRDSRWLA